VNRQPISHWPQHLGHASSPHHRVHSSADEISSLNHSPSISSSDESYSRTTDASPSPSPPPPHIRSRGRGGIPPTTAEHWLFPSDIQVNPCSSPELSPLASHDQLAVALSLQQQRNIQNNNNNPVTGDVTAAMTSSRSFSPAKNGAGSSGNNNNSSSKGSGRSSGGARTRGGAASQGGSSAGSRRSSDNHKVRKGGNNADSERKSGNGGGDSSIAVQTGDSTSYASLDHINRHQQNQLISTGVALWRPKAKPTPLPTQPPPQRRLRADIDGQKSIVDLESIVDRKSIVAVRRRRARSSRLQLRQRRKRMMKRKRGGGTEFERQIRKILGSSRVKQQQQPQTRFVTASGMDTVRAKALLQERALGLLEDENGTTSRPLLSRLEPDESEEGEEDEEEREANKLFEEEEKRIAKEVARQEAEVKRLLKESSRSLGVDSEWSEEDVCDVEEEEEEEEEVEEEEAASEPLLAGKGGGGKNEEEEEEEASDEEEEEGVEDSTGYTTDDPALENISMIHEAGLTDAEGALSDVNSAFEAGLMGGVRRGCGEGGGGGDDDNTSLSSRASSRVFGDSDAMMSLDSLSALYDSDNYDNCCYADDLRYYGQETTPDITNLADIRTMSESITRNFGQPRSETDSDV
ncbi:Ca(2+)/calmodulin-responsive adenylate cyclase, partial [Nilaparvata lugens]|uniref:Ca(2+)/calmodulin-responsive adenylate cyclase n=1 Tax=Nilaparvata lugens TaxID=108931 RepID=UPI00193DAA4F